MKELDLIKNYYGENLIKETFENEFNKEYTFYVDIENKLLYLIGFNQQCLEKQLNQIFNILINKGYNAEDIYSLYYVSKDSEDINKCLKKYSLNTKFDEKKDNIFYLFFYK